MSAIYPCSSMTCAPLTHFRLYSRRSTGPQVQGVCVVTDDLLYGLDCCLVLLVLADLALAFLSMAVEDDGRTSYHIVLEQLVQVFHMETGEVHALLPQE